MESLSAANTKFSLDLFKNITEHKKMDNIFYSPLSISSALAMVYMGARGNTATQMAEVLRFRKEKKPEAPGLQQQQVKSQLPPGVLKSPLHEADDDIHAGFNKLMSELNKEGAPYALSLANRLYGEQSYEFVEKYIQDTKKFYQAELETVDFKSKAEDERMKINSWVEKQTQDKIKNLLSKGAVDNMTSLVLVNAIYFKADWDKKFKGRDTYEQLFKLNKVLGFTKEKEPEVNSGQQQQLQRHQLPLDVLKSLHSQTDDDIHAEFSKLMSELNKEGAPYALSLANRLYGEQSYEFVEKFIMDTKKFYQAELETVDFKSKAEDERVKINSWVEKQTQDKIKNLLSKGAVNSMTRLVLVNAIYFKADWDKKFKGRDTYEQLFKLNELEKELTYNKFIEWTQPEKMKYTPLVLAVPKFKMEESNDLEDILVNMEMKDAFDVSKSDFSGMSPSNDLVLSKVVHKAFVEVNEEGTEAAAATAATMIVGCSRPPPDQFIADHPFLFFIRHNPTQSILFYGRFCSP
ncbi:serpin B6-like [Conger conger]|uniref:serpin B6-like n=1 Tax=Conger conger TaxID=82655 RepID=UPI002A5AB13C|nr:serpin B6-like [Conger conger]